MTAPNIHCEVIETNDAEQTVVVRYWSDLLSQDMLANDLDEQGQPRRRPDGKPLRCRTDVSLGVDPAMDPASPEFITWAMQWANVQWFQLAEDALAGTVTPVSQFMGTVSSPRIAMEREIQLRLDAFARTRGYDNIGSAANYAGDEDPQFDLEGTYCKRLRSQTWRKCYAILADVLAGTRPTPTLEEVLAELPAMQWPDQVAAA